MLGTTRDREAVEPLWGRPRTSTRRRWGAWTEPLIAVALAGGAAAAMLAWAPPGGDLAAHLYEVRVAKTALWDNFWYAGSFSYVSYSPLWTPLAIGLGIFPVGVASILVGAGAYAALVDRVWGNAARWSARSFGLVWGGTVLWGTYPFLLGVAFGLVGLWSLVRWWQPGRGLRSWPLAGFGLLAALALASSALAFFALAMVCAIAAVAQGRSWRRLVAPLAVVVVLGLAEVLLIRAFPGDGTYPFWVSDLAEILGFCLLGLLLTWRVPRARVLVAVFVAYAVTALVGFVVPSPVGSNLARLRDASVPVIVLAAGLRAWRGRLACLGAVALAIAWTVPAPATVANLARASAASHPAYWAPAVNYLRGHLLPSYRVEALDTAGHWPSYGLAGAGIPLVRGWFRQDDFPTDSILYRSVPLTSSSYIAWLRSLGVAYVVAADIPPDFSSQAELALLASGHSGLSVAWQSPDVTIYALPGPTSMVTGPAPASLLALHRTSMSIRVDAPGRYRVAVHWSPYWHTSAGCVTRSPGGMTTLVASSAGVAHVSFRLSAAAALDGIVGAGPPSCPVG